MIPTVWAVWPTVHPELSDKMAQVWQEQGYRVAVLVNPPHGEVDVPHADKVVVQYQWGGFPCAVNRLCEEVPGNIVVVVGDDVYPDPHQTASEIGMDFLERFPDTFGVMQPCGDKFGSWDKCAVSPWIGRAFIEKVYDGAGPYWDEYFHYFSDEELQKVAMKLGAFQQREDLTQFHDHWQRKSNPDRPGFA